MKKKALTELYFGRINGLANDALKIPGYVKARPASHKLYDKLEKKLGKSGRELPRKYSDSYSELELCSRKATLVLFLYNFQQVFNITV